MNKIEPKEIIEMKSEISPLLLDPSLSLKTVEGIKEEKEIKIKNDMNSNRDYNNANKRKRKEEDDRKIEGHPPLKKVKRNDLEKKFKQEISTEDDIIKLAEKLYIKIYVKKDFKESKGASCFLSNFKYYLKNGTGVKEYDGKWCTVGDIDEFSPKDNEKDLKLHETYKEASEYIQKFFFVARVLVVKVGSEYIDSEYFDNVKKEIEEVFPVKEDEENGYEKIDGILQNRDKFVVSGIFSYPNPNSDERLLIEKNIDMLIDTGASNMVAKSLIVDNLEVQPEFETIGERRFMNGTKYKLPLIQNNNNDISIGEVVVKNERETRYLTFPKDETVTVKTKVIENDNDTRRSKLFLIGYPMLQNLTMTFIGENSNTRKGQFDVTGSDEKDVLIHFNNKNNVQTEILNLNSDK